jgi:Ca-activated chloride channel homolog
MQTKTFPALAIVLIIAACAEQSGEKTARIEPGEPAPSGEVHLGLPTPIEQENLATPSDPGASGNSNSPTAREIRPRFDYYDLNATKAEQGMGQVRSKRLADTASVASYPVMPESRLYPHHYPHHYPQRVDRENYLDYEQNNVKLVSEEPVSTFSIDVDSAAYANVRRMLSQEGRLPPTDAVRVEEMINYFDYEYPVPDNTEQPFTIHTELAAAPWSEKHRLVQIGLKGFEPATEERPAANLVFLVDVSGSMRSPNKLGLVKKSLRLLVNNMRADDRIALAVYAGAAGTVLESTPGNQKAKILSAIDSLEAGGSTHGSAGIKLAYALAEENIVEGGINRVIIASDGDMNVGTVSIEALKDLITRKRKSGIALTTLGFGTGNYNDALMEQLADVGNGNASYIDSLKEAHKVLVNEMQSTLLTIAADVKIQVEFNPALVSEYRLIGYENRLLNREDFANDKVDAGDIGAGHTVTALYEIVLAAEAQGRIPTLRYQKQVTPTEQHTNELAYVKLRYKAPGESSSKLLTQVLHLNEQNSLADSAGSDDIRFAASVAGFGELLRGGSFSGDWDYRDALELARETRGKDPHGYRSEFIHLIELAQSLSSGS